jgi:hypothetical protein
VADDTRYLNWLDELIADGTNLPVTRSDDGYDLDFPAYNAWRTRAEHFLLQLLDSDHVYYTRFHSAVEVLYGKYASARTSAIQILTAVKNDLAEGRLTSFRAFVTAEVFSDFLDMAEHLVEHGYQHPAASLIGAVLERGLRDIATKHDITVRSRDDLTSLANRLAEKGVYNRLTQKNLNVWIAIRNHADHGEFDEYTPEQVRSMHAGVSTFLSRYGPQ